MADQAQMVKVWDSFVRFFHWTVVVGFFIAYFTDDDLLTLHVWAGYVIGGLLVLRVLWGFVGPRHARFTDFIYRPSAVTTYLANLARFRARRYLGHSPAGGAMTLALMLGLAATVWTGLEFYTAEENAGPLAAATTQQDTTGPAVILVSSDENEKEDDERDERGNGSEYWEELHEVLANLTLILVIAHIAGVALASLAHRENLARAMVTGYKRAE